MPDGGLGDNVEPAMYGQRFEAALSCHFREAAEELAVVVGRHCGSADVLMVARGVPRLVVRRETWSDLVARDHDEQGSAGAQPPKGQASRRVPR